MIKDIDIKFNLPDERIKWAREYNNKCMLHVHGVGLDEALEKINNYENDEQKLARIKFAISNKHITDRLLRPTDNVFAAKGGYRKYVFTGNQEENEDIFLNKLVNIHHGYSLSQYIQRIWFDKYIVDPNGLIFLEVTTEGDSIYPTYKSIHSIRNYCQSGIKVDWVIFEPDEVEVNSKGETEKELFWAVDDEAYYRCSNVDGVVQVLEIKEHMFGEVPAVLASDIEDPVTGWKRSPIDQQLELLNKYMIDSSVRNIVEFFHEYPQMWTYVNDCKRCNGTGTISGGIQRRDGSVDNTCPICGGTGKSHRKDVTDVLELTVPKEDEQKIDPPAGYIYMDVAALEVLYKAMQQVLDMITYSHWSASLEYGNNEGSQYATATGRFIDAQPVNNRLNRYTDSVEIVHNNLASLFGKFYFPETFKRSEIIYGRRYLIETPNQLLKRYSELKQYDVSNDVIYDTVFEQYIESEFKENEQSYIYYKKLNSLDPMPHKTLDAVLQTNMTELIDRKIYLNDYKNARDMNFFIVTPFDKLKEDYLSFIKKVKGNGNKLENVQGLSD